MDIAIRPPLPPLRRRRRALAAQPPFNRYLLSVHFEAPDDEEWSAIGGGESVAEAIAAAREALPDGPDWDVARWNHLYGD
jgi:hypothetical protein